MQDISSATRRTSKKGRTKPAKRGSIRSLPSCDPKASLSDLQIGAPLLDWYDANARNLPWRNDRGPYRVWLSEVMLQQTRVAAVIDHYQRFLRRFPTLAKLAAARESSVLAAWSGLGYYRRARMLHAAAKVVVKEHDGKFPSTSAELRALPGVGRYTAAAIASIAFGESVAVVDGNVKRVITRLLGRPIAGDPLWREAQNLLARDAYAVARPGDFNQAVMELGATVCVPGQPKCLYCPLAAQCATRGELPLARSGARAHKRDISYLLALRAGQIYLTQRDSDASLMPLMWELPEVASPDGTHRELFQLRHAITVTNYRVRVLSGEPQTPGQWFSVHRFATLPLTGLARKILRRAGVI
jgi:A/G-specific adenine glycosylase